MPEGELVSMLFDLRTCDSAYRFVLDCLNMTPDEFITEFTIESEGDFELFWEKNIQSIMVPTIQTTSSKTIVNMV